MSRLGFQLQAEATGSRARAGSFRTAHNEVQTPIFMPVGTHATVRGQRMEALSELGFSVLLANTYHLMLRPGAEVFKKMGGIQRFMGWERSVLTDSGGFQIFSLPNERVLSEEGALFRSYVDNAPILLTPERSIEMQKAIGSNIMMVLDQCIPSTAVHAEAEAAMHLTHRWARRSFEARGESTQSLFGIVQGACYPDLRKESARVLSDIPFDGFAIGGLAVGEGKDLREEMTEHTTDLLPRSLPRYLMGVGTPLDLLEAVHRGVDMFDCIIPTALGQQGVAFTSRGRLDIRRGAYKFADHSLDTDCNCIACTRHSLAYLHHLIRVKESLGKHLIAAHNLHFYARLMREMRASILDDSFRFFYQAKKEAFQQGDRNFPITHPTVSKRRGPPRELGDYLLHESRPGIFSVKHSPSGEIMHATNEPMAEARTLYVKQSQLKERLCAENATELVLWDVGLGAALNAMAALECFEQTQADRTEQKLASLRPLHLISFETDLNSLKLALHHQNIFKHLRHAAPVKLLEQGVWKSKTMPVQWTLVEGDFKKTMQSTPAPDLIYFDPFSLNTDTESWTLECFRQLFEVCGGQATELYTYSSSTAVRALMLAAGFYVAKGAATGTRVETTIALTPKALQREQSPPVLASQWLERWERSQAKFPASLHDSQYTHFEKTIRSHPQFL